MAKSHLSHQQMLAIKFGEGADPRTAYSKMSKRQRRLVSKRAAKRGVTLEGYIKGGPKALQERSAVGMRRQARRTMDRVYAPELKAITRDEEAAKALRSKQETDERSYQEWVAARTAELNQQSQTVDAEVNRAIGSARARAEQDYAADAAEATAHLQGQAGLTQPSSATISNQAGKEQAAAKAEAQAGYEGQQALSRNALARVAQQAIIANSQNARAGQDYALHQSLAKLAEGKEKLRLAKGSDTAKELSRLKDQQIAIAQQRQGTELAARKLGLDAADDAADRRLDKAKLRLARRNQAADERDDAADNAVAQQNADANTLRATKSGQGSGAKGALTPRDKRTNQQAYDEIVNLTNDPNGRPSVTYRRNPLLVQAAKQAATRTSGKATYAIAKKIQRIYGIKIPHDPPISAGPQSKT